MDIAKIDKNFAAQNVAVNGEIATYTIPSAPFRLYGVFYSEEEGRFFRMDAATARAVSEGCDFLNENTAGGRLKFSTDSDYFEIGVTYNALSRMSHMPLSGSGGFVLIDETGGKSELVCTFRPDYGDEKGFRSSAALKGGMRSYVLYFPLYNDVTSLKIGLNASARVEEGLPYKNLPPVLYYGSSITQGGCASRADNAYSALVCKWNNVDFINLGFSGSAKGEEIMREYLAGIPCSAFVCDYDHNAPNAEHLAQTHYAVYKTFRDKNPNVPVVLMSKPDFDRDLEGERRLKIVYSTYLRAKREGDKNIYFLSGKKLYPRRDRENCAVDGCHPNDFGFYCMAKAVARVLNKILEK
ncbi:MAG: hypothetical protein DBX59_02295 [Bacillota bacterium]|nr:MAG: hypothetical protein DBX59_02295 [Bacillota bacterium]